MKAIHLRIAEETLQIDFFLAVRTRLLLPNDTPAANTKLMKNMMARQFVGIFNDTLFLISHQQLIAADGTHVLLQRSIRYSYRRVILQKK